jgi:hypothetical protein
MRGHSSIQRWRASLSTTACCWGAVDPFTYQLVGHPVASILEFRNLVEQVFAWLYAVADC